METIPLQDHFRPPLSLRRHWHAFHNAWATYLASDLNRVLPEGYFAEPNVQFGIEIDVAAFEERSPAAGARTAWNPPAPTQTIPFAVVTDVVEVLIYDGREGPFLAAVIELVSPANKDRPSHREAFVSKCETYLQSRAGLVIVDIVTARQGSLHVELLARLGRPGDAASADLYTASYRPVEHDGDASLDIWHQPLQLAQLLPTMPLSLRGDLCLPLELGMTYDRTCREQRLPIKHEPA